MRVCPCFSGAPYKECCAPFHRGEREAPDPEALMRSRYAAFAAKEYAYLFRTLHATHEDRALSLEAFALAARRASEGRKYLGLTILAREGPDATGLARVHFSAKIFERGADRSFSELSDFLHDGVGWRYVAGVFT